MTTLEATLREMRDAGAIGTAVVSRDGSVIASDLPPNVSPQTLSIMCATAHGAGMTVSNELKRGALLRIVLESDQGRVLITEAGRRALLVVVLPDTKTVEETWARLQPLADAVAREAA